MKNEKIRSHPTADFYLNSAFCILHSALQNKKELPKSNSYFVLL